MAVTVYDTTHVGIKVKVDPTVSPIFYLLVKDALQAIYSKPIGKSLIDSLVSDGVVNPTINAKVVIMRAASMEYGTVKGNKQDWKGGSKAVRLSEAKAVNGTGTGTVVYWNPNTINTPDGARPGFIALAHELCHALHNLNGTAIYLLRDEEEWTVGLNAKLQVGPNENQIRKEHGVPHRATYSSEDFDLKHDTVAFGDLNT
jgi:hypothetical protein